MDIILRAIALAVFVCQLSYAHANVKFIEVEYEGFTLWLDCSKGGAVMAEYPLSRDGGQIPRQNHKFYVDETVPQMCQPNTNDSYRTEAVNTDLYGTFDRGHLVPANHLDNHEQSFHDSFYLTNILPQQSDFNQDGGAWYETELLSECYRDVSDLQIWVGVIWGDDRRNDFFGPTHGVLTPDYWWKVIKREDNGEYIAWLFPNSKESTREKLDDFLVSIDEIINKAQIVPDFGATVAQKKNAAEESWAFERGRVLKCEGISTSRG